MHIGVFNPAIVLILSTMMIVPSLIGVPGFAQTVPCTNWDGRQDNDCDGLANTWETGNYNGLILPGANPEYKDIYLELDYMQNHKPRTGVVDAVVSAFRNAPVDNPNGTKGINLHVDVDEQISHQNSITLWSNFDTLKDINFGTSDSERNDPVKMLAKLNTYHYALFIHQYNGGSSSGNAERPGTDFVVSLGATGWGTNNGHTVGSIDQQKGTLMHELGHNLGLRHGGNVDENCKPNYLSVMSYSFQFSNYVSDRRLDYSRSQLDLLDEASLSEPNGVSPASTPSGQRTVYGPSSALISQQLSNPTNQINWDRDSNPTETGISKNINNLGTSSGCTSTLNTFIAGYKDWLNLQYWGIGGGYANGTTTNATILGNVTTPGNMTFPTNGTIPGNVTFPTNVTIPGNITILGNLTNTGIPWDSREGLDEMTVENLVASRLSLLESIDNYIHSLPDEDFRNTISKNVLIDRITEIPPLLIQGPSKAINSLAAIRNQMDSSFGGNGADDLLTNPEKQIEVVPHIDNLIQALEKQR